MNRTLHNVTGLALAMALATILQWLAQRTTTKRASSASVNALGVLFLAGLASAAGHSTESFGMVALLSWTTFLHVPFYQVSAATILRKRSPSLARAYWVTTGILGLVALDAFIIEPHWLDVNTYTLSSEKLTEPVRVVVLADIQTDKPGDYEARVLKTAMEQDPDLILLAGDYIHLGRRSDGYETEIEALHKLLAEADVHAPLGVYAIEGNVDEPGWTHAFDDLPITVVEETTTYDLGPVVLTGLAMEDSFHKERVVEAQDAYHIVVGHSPNFSLAPVEADLLIAGHTHGGQVQIPFIGPVISLSVVPRSWAAGLTTIEPGKTLLVSRGIGMERANAPRMRLFCRPELVVIDLVPAE